MGHPHAGWHQPYWPCRQRCCAPAQGKGSEEPQHTPICAGTDGSTQTHQRRGHYLFCGPGPGISLRTTMVLEHRGGSGSGHADVGTTSRPPLGDPHRTEGYNSARTQRAWWHLSNAAVVGSVSSPVARLVPRIDS